MFYQERLTSQSHQKRFLVHLVLPGLELLVVPAPRVCHISGTTVIGLPPQPLQIRKDKKTRKLTEMLKCLKEKSLNYV